MRLAVDVGGTFTDVVLHDPEQGQLAFAKVPTTPQQPAVGVLDGVTAAGIPLSEISYFAHGATLGLNALLTRTGARTGIVTTAGFRDVYLLGRTDRPVSYDFKYRKPQSLVPREWIFEVPERLDYRGQIILPLDMREAHAVARRIAEIGLEAVAVCFLHSYVNDVHEVAMAEVLRSLCPGVDVTTSHSLSREYREYERTSTTVLDAYIRPVMRQYVTELEHRLDQEGFTGNFFIIRSGGGAMTASRAKEKPVELILSGPAGGVMGAAEVSRITGRPNLIGVDMGGTSLDASLVVNGEPLRRHETVFQGLPITVPSLHIDTIGAGGSSVLWLDEGGHLQVGPDSAGADPGPAAYARGGTVPTLTDAALICGYVGPEVPLAGSLALREDLARDALSKCAAGLGMSVEDTAIGALRIAETKMVGAIRGITVELGYTPSDFGLLAFGGAGGLVACDVARELQIEHVIIPPGAGAFSAFGMLMADVKVDLAQTRVGLLTELSPEDLEAAFRDMEVQALGTLAGDGFSSTQCQVMRGADLRYSGQEHSVLVPIEPPISPTRLEQVAAAFNSIHEARYGHSLSDPIELVALRVAGTAAIDRPALPKLQRQPHAEPSPLGARNVLTGRGEHRRYLLFRRESLAAGDQVVGPAVISELTGTTVLHHGDVAEVGDFGELTIAIGRI